MNSHLDHGDSGQVKVLAMSGSLRRASTNTGLLRAGQEVAPAGMEISIFNIADLPFYNGDIEAEGDPAPVAALKAAIRDADGVIFATPEYNWGASGALKNVVDWASRAGGRAGTARAQMQLQESLAETGSLVMVKPGVLVQSFAPPRFDSRGNLIDRETRDILRAHLEKFAEWTLRLARPGEFVRHVCEMDVDPAASGTRLA